MFQSKQNNPFEIFTIILQQLTPLKPQNLHRLKGPWPPCPLYLPQLLFSLCLIATSIKSWDLVYKKGISANCFFSCFTNIDFLIGILLVSHHYRVIIFNSSITSEMLDTVKFKNISSDLEIDS